ncbi:MAG: right-handed parallel beta-helix repeat-containing protein, partial [Saprospiraceae bacterium]
MTDCTFSGNTATNSGGGMYSTSSSPTVTDCTFSGNTAGSGGATINSGGSPVFSNCLFSNNMATLTNGGGMSNGSSTSTTLTNCTFSGNTAAYNGGGMFNSSSSPTLTNCTFSGNTAANSGGGIRNESSTAITLNGCIFTANSATADNGGGLYLGTGSTSGTLTNCLFSGNFAGGTGGGIQNNATAISLTNCTVSGNRAGSSTGGGGIVFSTTSSSEPILKNCLVWNNRSSTTTGSATANLYTSSSTPVITYSLIQNQTPSGTGNLDGTTNAADSNYPAFTTPLDPATAPSTGGDFHLTNCSPVLNLGDNTGAPATDLFGNARPFGTTVDLGVHELQAAPENVPPSITCPANTTVAADGSCAGTVGIRTAASSGDNCGAPTVVQSPASGTVLSGHNDMETVVLTATDGAGNTATCSFTVTLKDATAPTITCPGDQTVSADGSCAGVVGIHAAASSGDNCGAPTVAQSPASGTVLSGHNDMETVVLTATDGAGNTATCSFTVTLKDATAPSITCPSDQTVAADGSCAGTVGIHAAASSGDNCGAPTVAQSPASGTVLSGHNDMETVVLTATDGAGNT